MNQGQTGSAVVFLVKKSLVWATVLAVAFLLFNLSPSWFGLPWAEAATGNAVVTTQPLDTEFRPAVGHKASAVFAIAKFGLKDADGTADDTLNSVAVTVVAGTPAAVSADFAMLNVYKDNGDGIFAVATDTKLGADQTTVNVGSATTVTTATDALSGSASATTYFVTATLAAGAVEGHKFTVNLANNGVNVTGAAVTTNAFTGTTNHVVDNTAPVLANAYPSNGATNVPLTSFFNASFTDASDLDPSTISPTNITFTKGGTAVPFSLKTHPTSFDLVPSAAPTFVVGSKYSKGWNVTSAFADFHHNQAVAFDASVTFAVGDIVFFQNMNFPPEFGIVTNATLTGGTFAVNGFPLYGPQRVIKVTVPTATGLVSGTTAVTTGDLLLIKSSVNPNTGYGYRWTMVTTGAAINGAGLRVNGAASAAPTFETGSRFSSLIPSGTATDNGVTSGGLLAVSVGDIVFVKKTGDADYSWHMVTTAGNLSSDSGEGTAVLDGLNAAQSLVVANSQMSKLTPAATGAVADATVLANGDVIFASATAGVLGNLSGYDWHFVSQGAAINNVALRLDNAPGNLLPSSTYVVTIGTGVKDLAGNALAAASTISFATSSNDPSVVQLPPRIESTSPMGGSTGFSPNGNIYVTFPQGSAGNMLADGTANAVNNTSNIVLQLAVNGMPSGSALAYAATWDATTRELKIDPTASLTASTAYILTIKHNITNVTGQPLPSPDYLIFFTTGAGNDTTAPTVIDTDPKNGATGVIRNLPSIRVQFSEAVDNSTLTAANTVVWKDSDGDGTLNGAEAAMTVSRNYDTAAFALSVGLQALLDQNTKYCVKVTTGVKDITGNAFAGVVAKCFTTVNATFTAAAPTVMFADADTYHMWIEFDQAVDFTAGPFGAINKQNYKIENPLSTQLDLNNATFSARPEARAVEVTGLALQPGTVFKVTVTNVKESSGSLSIVPGTGDTGQGTVMSPTAGGNFGSTDTMSFDQKNFGDFWMKPEFCEPQNRLPEQTSRWKCQFPSPAALATGAKIILTMPAGFDVTNAAAVSATESWDNKDVNGWGPGTTTISAVAANVSAQAVTITLAHSGSAMVSGDQLMFELKDIKNAATAGEKTVTAIVKDASGVKVGQTVSFAPFDLMTAGSRSISGTLCKSTTSGGACAGGDTGVAGIKIMMDSMRGMGHFETTTDVNGDYTFGSLTDGDYGVGMMMDMSNAALSTLGGGGQWKQVNVSGANVVDVDFKMVDLATVGKTLTVTVAGLPANENFDIFCNAGNFNYQFSAPIMKKGTADGSGAATVTMKLQDNTTYECGLGPHIPMESFTSGPPPMPTFTFMPPPMQKVSVAGADVALTFTLVQAINDLKVKVTDGTTGIPNVYVDAFPVAGKGIDATTGALFDMGGSFGQTKSDGTVTLKLTIGTYNVNACAPGMPCPPPVTVDVKANSSTTDGNLNADVYQGGTLLTGDGLIIKLAKSTVTVQGQLQDENGAGIPYGFVDAEQVSAASDTCSSFTSRGAWAGSPTDSNGNYTVYVPPFVGSDTTFWKMKGFAPAYGEVGCTVITVAAASKTGQNLKATATDFGKVKITAQKGGAATEGAFVGCYGPNGGNHGKTGTDGTVTFTMKAGTYTCDGHLPGAGPLTPQADVVVASAATTNVTLSVGNPGTVTINLGATITDAFCSVTNTTGRGDYTHYSGSTVTMKVPAGTYTAECGAPFIGKIKSESVTVVAGQTNALNWTADAPTLRTVSGEVEDASGANISGATVTFTDQSSGRKVFAQTSGATGADVNLSVSLPDGTYSVQGLKDGFNDNTGGTGRPEVLVVDGNETITKRAMSQATANNVSVTVQAGTANFGGDARVIATRSDGKVAFKDIDSTVTSGANTQMSLADGTWTVEVKSADGRKDGTPATVTVTSNAANSMPTLTLDTAITGFTYIEPTTKGFNPSTGGDFTDDRISGLSAKMDVQNEKDTTSGTIEMKKAPNVPSSTASGKMVGVTGYSITPKDSGGKELHDATGVVKIPVTTAELTSAGLLGASPTAAQITTALTKVSIGRLNALGDYEALSTTATKDAVAADTHLLVARTTSFSDFAPITAADNAPIAPTNFAGTAASNTSITLTWTASAGATSYDIYRNTSATGSFPRVGSEPTVGAVTTYTDTGLSQNTTYYYKISAINNSGESAATPTAISVATKNEGGGIIVGGGGGGGSVGPYATQTTPAVAEQVTVDTTALALSDLTAVAGASYAGATVSKLTSEVAKTVAAISVLVQKGELSPANVSAARSAIKKLLVGVISVTIQKIQLRLAELLVS